MFHNLWTECSIKSNEHFILKIYQPIGSSRIWDDSGSGADDDVAIWSLTPPSAEYECVGHVATKGYWIQPNLSNYRCVRKDYLGPTAIRSSSIWDDSGSGADDDFAAFKILQTPGTLPMGLFWSHRSHGSPGTWTKGLRDQSSVQCTSSYSDCTTVEFQTY